MIWKGAIIGGIIGFILSIIVNLVLSRNLYHFLNFLPTRFLVSLTLVLIFGLLGLFVGFLSLLCENNLVWKSAFIGGSGGLISSFFIYDFLFEIELFRRYFFSPIFHLNTLITDCKVDCMYMIVVYPIIIIFIFVLIFSIIAFIIAKIKNRF